MKGILSVLLALVLACSLSGVLAVPVFAQSPSEVWVDDDYTSATPGWGITHFFTIQDGIDAVGSGGTVYVAEGTYRERITISKSLTLYGEDREETIVEYPSTLGVTQYLVLVDADNVRITGFKLVGHFAATNRAVYVVYSYKTGLIFEENSIQGFIGLFGNLTNGEVRANYIDAIRKGVYVSGGNNILIDGNTFGPAAHAGAYWYNCGAIYMDHVTDAIIRGNTMRDFWSSTHPTITAGRGIEGSHNSFITISGNTFENIRDAITMWIVTNVSISENLIDCSDRFGINIKGQDILIRGNTIQNSGHSGINVAEFVIPTKNVVINYNNLVRNERFGVVINKDGVNVGNVRVDATLNWWGSPTGPSRQLPNGKWVGKGDKVSANVAFVPWLPKPVEFWKR